MNRLVHTKGFAVEPLATRGPTTGNSQTQTVESTGMVSSATVAASQ